MVEQFAYTTADRGLNCTYKTAGKGLNGYLPNSIQRVKGFILSQTDHKRKALGKIKKFGVRSKVKFSIIF